MPHDPRGWELWRFAAGGVVLLIIGLYNICDAVRERSDRSDVIAHGNDAQAHVLRATGLESVLIEWTDQNGKPLTTDSKVGKPFARTSSGATVAIKYDPQAVRGPVILSQAEERERINSFWLRSSLSEIVALAAVYAVLAFWKLWRARRMREPAPN
jgi:hypothetical protein